MPVDDGPCLPHSDRTCFFSFYLIFAPAPPFFPHGPPPRGAVHLLAASPQTAHSSSPPIQAKGQLTMLNFDARPPTQARRRQQQQQQRQSEPGLGPSSSNSLLGPAPGGAHARTRPCCRPLRVLVVLLVARLAAGPRVPWAPVARGALPAASPARTAWRGLRLAVPGPARLTESWAGSRPGNGRLVGVPGSRSILPPRQLLRYQRLLSAPRRTSQLTG